jgi:hypothetical protein
MGDDRSAMPKRWSPGSQDIEGPLLVEILWLARMYAAFTVLALTVLAARLVGIGQFSILGLEVPMDGFTGISVLATLVHFYRARWIRSLLLLVSVDQSDGLQVGRILQEVRKSDSLFLRGFIPRVRLGATLRNRVNVYVMEKTDPTSIVTYGANFITFFALLPFRVSSGHLLYSGGWPGICLTLAAPLFCVANWQAACQWLIPFSMMSIRSPDEEFTDMEERGVITSSGGGPIAFLIGVTLGIILLPIWLPPILAVMGWDYLTDRLRKNHKVDDVSNHGRNDHDDKQARHDGNAVNLQYRSASKGTPASASPLRRFTLLS